jgi:hypothetical protein
MLDCIAVALPESQPLCLHTQRGRYRIPPGSSFAVIATVGCRLPELRGNLHCIGLSRPAVRQPSLAGQVALTPRWSRQQSLALLSANPEEQTTHHAPTSRNPAGPRGILWLSRAGVSANQRMRRVGPSAAIRHKTASGRSETACAPRKRSSA